MNRYIARILRCTKIEKWGVALLLGTLAACGGDGQNTDLPALGASVTDDQKDSYFVPDAIDFADMNSMPGEVVVTRRLITGLATNAEALITVSGPVEYALDPAVSVFNAPNTYEDDLTKLTFTTEAGIVTNSTWVVLRSTADSDFGDALATATITIGNSKNPLTLEDITNGLLSDDYVVNTVGPQTALPAAFDLGSVPDVAASATVSTAPLRVTSPARFSESAIEGITVAGTAISITNGEYQITRENGTVEAWTSAAGTVEPFDSVAVRAVASATPAGVVTATLTIGTNVKTFEVITVRNSFGQVDFPPPNSLTEDTAIEVRGTARILDTNAFPAGVMTVTFDPAGAATNVPVVNERWSHTPTLVPATQNTYVYRVSNNIGEPDQDFTINVTQGAIAAFPNATQGLNNPRDVTVDSANNRYLIVDNAGSNDNVVAVDMTTSARSEFVNLDTAFTTESNSWGIQIDPTRSRVLVHDRLIDTIHQFALVDPLLVGNNGPVSSASVGSGIGFGAGHEMDFDTTRDALLAADDGPGLFVVDPETGNRYNISTGKFTSVAYDSDGDQYLAVGPTPGIKKFTGISIDKTDPNAWVVEVTEGDFATALDAAITDPISIAVNADYNVAIVADDTTNAIYKIDLTDANEPHTLLSNATTPDTNNVILDLECVVIDAGIGHILVTDRDNALDALLAVDIVSGERVIITKD